MSEVAKLVGKVPWWVWAAGAAGVALYVIKKGGVAAATQSAVAGAVSGAGGLVESVGSGLVLGVGDVLGVPRLDETKCQMAKRLGNSLEASKYCGAGDYLSWQWDSLFSSGKVDFIGGGGTFNGHGASGSW